MRTVDEVVDELDPIPHRFFNRSTRPYVWWWWLKGPFSERDMAAQLDWVRENGFGGVEIAWLAPGWLGKHSPPPKWLSAEWTRLVTLASRIAAERDLGCDFTFGSCWPFGGTHVPEAMASQTFTGPSEERLHASWEDYEPGVCRVVNHLSRHALQEYAGPLREALQPAIQPGATAFFCDSLELQTAGLWDERLWDAFEQRFGYRLQLFADALDSHADVRYDYRKLIAETMTSEFYAAFSEISHGADVYSRVQCHASPTDLLASYASVDVPESEALLFDPHFSRIPASAAALSGKPVVSSETFTCIYGFSQLEDASLQQLWKKEDIHDLRLLADAVIANGVNQIVWHGMPFNPVDGDNEFYAAVHLGPSSGFADRLTEFNQYLTDVCRVMQADATMSQAAVYLPNEDNWMAGRIPEEERTPGATHRWQMRHVVVPEDVEGCHPLWVSPPALSAAAVEDRALHVGGLTFELLYVDCTWLDWEGMKQIHRVARDGLWVVIERKPREPGHRPHEEYEDTLRQLARLPNVVSSIEQTPVSAFASASSLPFYWARRTHDAIYVFLAHPKTRNLRFPMQYRQSRNAVRQAVPVRFCWGGHDRTITAPFENCGSVLLRLGLDGQASLVQLGF